MFKLWVLSLFLIFGYCQDSRPTFTLYNNKVIENATYINIFHADFSKVDYLSFQNEVTYCINGVWSGYRGESFTGSLWGIFPHLDICYKVSRGIGLRSLRVIGDPANYTTPAVSFFTKTGYYNDDNSVDPPNLRLEDDSDLGGKYASFILNGDQPITLYSATNFTGLKLCVLPKQYRKIATFVNNVEDMGIPPEVLKSFRFGCHSKNIARIPNDDPIAPDFS